MSLPSIDLRRMAAAQILLLLCFCALASAQNSDGPYVMRSASGALEAWTVESAAEGPGKQIRPLAANAKVTVKAVGTLPSFDVRLRGPAEVDADDIKTDA